MSRPKKQEVLVALLREVSDLAILELEEWYRIPLDKAPKWRPQWLAFYQPKAFKENAYRIEYYGRVEKIDVVPRRELINEFESAKSDKLYWRIQLEKLEKLENPIISLIPRRLLFVPTTWEKFSKAEFINDIFDDSPLEDELWRILKRENIRAERQWEVKIGNRFFYLDFAIFCKKGQIDVEADGDTFHRATKEQIDADLDRNNQLYKANWQPLRFSSRQIRVNHGKYVIEEIESSINRLDGLKRDSRVFYPKAGAQQLSLFEDQADYLIEDDEPDLD
ncbi:MAG TPA: DUF559 domain-containing protein [Anaerolineales bacterium]|nr:DUF559 domain-containing protein [Anaerolineales bacterium]